MGARLNDSYEGPALTKESGIYAIVNTVNDNFYIGSAVNFASRKRQHWHLLRNNKHHSPHLQAAWNKYGEAAFEFHPLFKCDKAVLIHSEGEAMEQLRPVYNAAPIAGSQLGMKHTPESRAKMSKTRKGLPLTQAQLDNLARMAEANRGRTRDPSEYAHLKGNTHAHGGLGVKKHAGHGPKISATLTGRKTGPQSPEHIAARVAGMQAYWAKKRAAKC